MQINFGKSSEDYANYRIDFAPELFDRLRRMEIGMAGQRVLDLGAGTGLLAGPLCRLGCDVTLLDRSVELLHHAKERFRVVGCAEQLPVTSNAFDVVTVAQCWHWFDRTLAPREIVRVMRPQGAVAVVYQTYIPTPGSAAEATERLILKHRPGWRHANSTGLNGQVLRDLQASGFVGIESFSFDIDVSLTPGQWRGFIRTTSPVGASMLPDQIVQFDREHEAMLRDWPTMLSIPHRVFAAIARKPGKRL